MKLTFQKLQHVFTSPTGEPRRVLDIPSWELANGEQILLQGVSGSGKTTLFNIATGLLRPTQGVVWYDDQKLYDMREAERDRFRASAIGYIFQSHYLIRTLTTLQNVVMPLAFARQLSTHEQEQRAGELLDTLGLGDHLSDYPATLSTGQRMRVAVARSLANHPRVLFADEPTAALDTDAANMVMDMIQQTCEVDQVTLVVASHDPSLRERFQTHAVLDAGQLHVQTLEASS